MKKNLFIIPIAALMLWGCSGNNNTGQSEIKSDSTIVFVDKVPADVKKTVLKSAIIHMKSFTMGLSQNIIIYMDDYGKKTYTEINQKFLGQEVSMCTIADSLYVYSYNPELKTGNRSKINKDGPDEINFNAITHEIAKKYNLKKKGTSVILGHNCDVYTLEYPVAKLKGTYYIWKGITLKNESELGGVSISMETTKIEENPVISPEKFVIPKDIKFEDAVSDN